MKLGLHISNFTFGDGGPVQLGPTVRDLAKLAEDVGFDNLTVMDHLWQISVIGPPENDMLEAYTALGFLAAHTSRVRLFTLVTGVTYRSPGLLAKAVTSLDVLSGGRAALGLGAAWNHEEATGLGLGYAPTAIRFEMLEEALQICLQMWSDSDGPYSGEHYQLGRTLNVPQSLQRPHPPIMVGGGGEKKTLRLVAKYADACNLFGGPEAQHKLDVLREHCEREGRDYDSIEKTATTRIDFGPGGQTPDQLLESLRELHELGFTSVHASVTDSHTMTPLETLGRDVIPVISTW
jgi:F420-dependent oxidoreductase-like protein